MRGNRNSLTLLRTLLWWAIWQFLIMWKMGPTTDSAALMICPGKQFPKCGLWTLWVPETLSEICEVKMIFITLRSCLPCWQVTISITVQSSAVGKAAGALAQNKTMAPDHTHGHHISQHHTLMVQQMAVSLKHVLDRVFRIINLINSQPFSTHLCNVLWWNRRKCV